MAHINMQIEELLESLDRFNRVASELNQRMADASLLVDDRNSLPKLKALDSIPTENGLYIVKDRYLGLVVVEVWTNGGGIMGYSIIGDASSNSLESLDLPVYKLPPLKDMINEVK